MDEKYTFPKVAFGARCPKELEWTLGKAYATTDFVKKLKDIL